MGEYLLGVPTATQLWRFTSDFLLPVRTASQQALISGARRVNGPVAKGACHVSLVALGLNPRTNVKEEVT